MRNGILNRASALFCLFLFSYIASPAFALEALAERPLLSFHLQPAVPKVGQELSVLVQLESDFSKNEPVLEALLGSSPVKVERVGELLWAVHFPAFSEVKSHDLLVNIHLRDKREAQRLQKAIGELKEQIKALNQEITLESDPVKKARLEAERDQKTSYRDELELALDQLKVFFKAETYTFSVVGDPNNPNFPLITGVSPAVIAANTNIRLVLQGTNFPNSPQVVIGGAIANVIAASSTQIEVLSPSFSQDGAKNIEITFPAQGGQDAKNAFLTSSLFVTSQSMLRNYRPVAVTIGYIKANWPNPGAVQLNGSSSYDENTNPFSYTWTVKGVPSNSSIVPGSTLAAVAQPTITPDKKGVYRVELIIRETNTPELLSSFPSIVTIEVN